MAVGALGHTHVRLLDKPIDIFAFRKPSLVVWKCGSCHKTIMVTGTKNCIKTRHADDTCQ